MDARELSEDSVKDFYFRSPEKAIAVRLTRIQKYMRDYDVLEEDFEQLLEAIERCYKQQDWERLIAFREAFQPFLDLRGFWTHSIMITQWVEEAAIDQGDTFNLARWTQDRADMLNQQGQYQNAEVLYQKSEILYQSLGKHEWALKSRHMRSMVLRAQGSTAEAQQLCETIIEEARALGLEQWLAHPLYVLALFVRDQGDIPRAESIMQDSLSRLNQDTEEAMSAQCHNFLGEMALRQKKYDQARIELETSLRLIQKVGIKRLEMTTRRLLGDLAMAEARYEEAEKLFAESMKIFEDEQLNDQPGQAQMLFSRARLMMRMKRLPRAAEMLEASLDIYRSVGNMRRVIGVSLLLLLVDIRLFRWKRAIVLSWQTFKVAYAGGFLHPRHLLSFFTLWRLQSM